MLLLLLLLLRLRWWLIPMNSAWLFAILPMLSFSSLISGKESKSMSYLSFSRWWALLLRGILLRLSFPDWLRSSDDCSNFGSNSLSSIAFSMLFLFSIFIVSNSNGGWVAFALICCYNYCWADVVYELVMKVPFSISGPKEEIRDGF